MKIRPDAAGMGPAIVPAFQDPTLAPHSLSIIDGASGSRCPLSSSGPTIHSPAAAQRPQDLDRWSLPAPSAQRPNLGRLIRGAKPIYSRTASFVDVEQPGLAGPTSLGGRPNDGSAVAVTASRRNARLA